MAPMNVLRTFSLGRASTGSAMSANFGHISLVVVKSNNKYSDSLHTVQKMKFSVKDFFSKCEQIRRKLRICSHLLKKP